MESSESHDHHIEIHCIFDDLIDPKSLKDHPKNPNKHGQDQIDELAELYKIHGVRHPIIVSGRSGRIVSGHGRKLAAIKAGIKEFPVVVQPFESEDHEYTFMVADNAIADWAELDMAHINFEMQNIGPEINLRALGIKGFTLDMAEKSQSEKQKVEHTCPQCGLVFVV